MKKTILLVDDEIDILDIQNRYLLQAGYDVLVAHDGKEGLELFRKKTIDLIITDIMMPNMDGYVLRINWLPTLCCQYVHHSGWHLGGRKRQLGSIFLQHDSRFPRQRPRRIILCCSLLSLCLQTLIKRRFFYLM